MRAVVVQIVVGGKMEKDGQVFKNHGALVNTVRVALIDTAFINRTKNGKGYLKTITEESYYVAQYSRHPYSKGYEAISRAIKCGKEQAQTMGLTFINRTNYA